MSLVALANAINGDLMVRRFHSDPRVRATELLLQERDPAAASGHRAAAGRHDVRVAAKHRRAAAPLSHAAHDHAAHAVPVERQVHGRGHQCRRRRQLHRSHGRDAFAPRLDHAIRAATSSTCATSGAARSGRRPILPTRREPERYLATFQPEIAVFDSKAEEIATKLEVGGLAGARRRGPPAASRQPQRSGPRDRRHQLRRDRAGA